MHVKYLKVKYLMSAIDVLLKNIRQTNELLEQWACNKASMAIDQL